MCICIYVPLSKPASSNWLDGRQCVCVPLSLPRPHPFSRCIDVYVYPFLRLFSLTSLMNVWVFHCATFLAFSYSVYCRLCFTSFLLLPLAPRLIDWMLPVCVASNSLINAFVFLYLSLVFEGHESKSAWTDQYLGSTRDSHVFFNSATPSLAVPVIRTHMLNLISGVMKRFSLCFRLKHDRR